jgi:aminopeptidase N
MLLFPCRYLIKYGGSNTSTHNLWDALDNIEEGKAGLITEVMDAWTKQQGFPWVKVG